MKGIKKILSMVLAIVCIIGLFPTAKVEASIVTVMVAIRQGLMRIHGVHIVQQIR